jgi:peroxiredoxin
MSSYNPIGDSSHSVTLSGLNANTGYHFQVIGNDPGGNFVFSPDNTFLTAPSLAKSTSVTSIFTMGPTLPESLTLPQSVIVGKGQAADTVAPTITLSPAALHAYKVPPTFSGTASDDKGVANVEYSTDGGKNWLPAAVVRIASQQKVTYTFTPLLPQDGNYVVLAKATDTGGNVTTTASQIIIIDRLPPIVGGNVVSSGPQISEPSSDGTIKSLEGVDQKITLSAVGGPTAITLEASTANNTKKSSKTFSQNFSMTFSADTGLWSGILSFARSGTYTLTANASDGAGNKTSRALNTVHVSSPGHSWDKKTHKAISSTVTVFYLEPETHAWVVWDGQAFGQINPQKTDQRMGKTGSFSMLLPAGTYYMKAQAPGYHTLVGSIFTINQPTPLTTDLSLAPIHGIHLGEHYLSLPNLSVQQMSLSPDSPKNVNPNNLIGLQTPNFSLVDTNGTTVHAADLLGLPTIISFESTWSPTTAEQLSALASLQSKSGINVVPVALQEQPDRVRAYTDTAGVQLRWLVDPDSTLSASYHVQSLPLHYFIDRKGIIRQVVVGVLSDQEMLDRLTGL